MILHIRTNLKFKTILHQMVYGHSSSIIDSDIIRIICEYLKKHESKYNIIYA